MFSNGFPKEWSTLRKLAWLYRTVINAVVSVLKTVIGNPIHITDALAKPAQALSVKLEPIQDLHGYDAPWPAGGGKNLLDASTVTGTTSSTVTVSSDGKRIDIVATSGGYNCAKIDATSLVGKGDFYLSFYAERTSGSQNSVSCNGDYRLNGATKYNGISSSRAYVNDKIQATDLVVNFPEGATNAEIKLYINNHATLPTGGISGYFENVRLCKEQAQPWTPYSNICPISGHTDADVTRTGKNLLNKANVLQNLFINTSQKKISPIGATGACVYCAIKGGEKYTVSKMASARFTIATTTELPALNVAINNHVGNNTATSLTIQTTEDDNYIVAFVFLENADAGKTQQEILDTVQCELGSTATAYEPYAGETYSITFPTSAGTVYGGTLDVTTGKLTVTMVKANLYGSGITVSRATTQISGKYRFQIQGITGMAEPSSTAVATTAICNRYPPKSADSLYSASSTGFAIRNSYIVHVYDETHSADTAEDFKAYLQTNDVYIVYPLATPIEVDLTPTEITTLLGTNNLWSDGTMTLVYLADGNASDIEALNILLGNRYVNNHGDDEPTDREALDIILGGNER